MGYSSSDWLGWSMVEHSASGSASVGSRCEGVWSRIQDGVTSVVRWCAGRWKGSGEGGGGRRRVFER